MSTLTVEHFEDYYDKKNEKEYSKFNKRRQRKQRTQKRDSLELRTISPMTENQSAAFALFDKGDNLMLHGVAGTGKTFISLYLALDELMNGSDLLDKIIIVRSVVPTRDIGFLPGKESEKMAVYEQPYKAICSQITNRGDGYDILKTKGKIEFISTSFIRGNTYDDSIIIIDEFQNMTDSEINSIMTRVGANSRVIVCGDFRQTDLTKPHEQSGAKLLLQLWSKMGYGNSNVEFEIDDIVRSGFVRQWIEARDEMNLV
jgi:predicted ribonuclease YlaK|tara:strand:- start:1008 stop:1781 length:774 start_codon:yes stop_codon:yes gene_type:complete